METYYTVQVYSTFNKYSLGNHVNHNDKKNKPYLKMLRNPILKAFKEIKRR